MHHFGIKPLVIPDNILEYQGQRRNKKKHTYGEEATNNAKVWYNYGNYLRDQEVKETAATCYKEAVRLWPDYVIALNNLATVTDNQTDIETLLLKALQLDSGLLTWPHPSKYR